MRKHITVRPEIADELDNLKDEIDGSYSEVIEFLLKERGKKPIWFEYTQIFFNKLKGLIPDMQSLFELMKMITISFYRLKRETRIKHYDKIHERLYTVWKHIDNIKEE